MLINNCQLCTKPPYRKLKVNQKKIKAIKRFLRNNNKTFTCRMIIMIAQLEIKGFQLIEENLI